MARFWAVFLFFLANSSLQADVVSFDFKNASDRSAFTAVNSTNGIWAGSSTNGYVLGSPGGAVNGSATLTQNTSFQFGQTGTATISINHFWFFPMNVNGARMSISSDGGSTWGYAGFNFPGSFTAYGYNNYVYYWPGGGTAWTDVFGSKDGGQVTSVYQFDVTDPTANYLLRFEALFSGDASYAGVDIWGINTVSVSVPEPSSLLLGCIASFVVAFGYWLKRGRKASCLKNLESLLSTSHGTN